MASLETLGVLRWGECAPEDLAAQATTGEVALPSPVEGRLDEDQWVLDPTTLSLIPITEPE